MSISFVAAGTASATDGSAPTPGLPADLVAGDVMVAVFYSREATDGTVSISAGWNQVVNELDTGGLLGVWWRVYQAGDAAPTFTLGNHSTGASGDTAIAQIAAWRGVDQVAPVDAVGTVDDNGAGGNIGPISGVTLGALDTVVVIGGKRDDWTSVATLSGDGLTWAEIGEPDSASGSDAGLVWDYAINAGGSVSVGSKTFTTSISGLATGKGVMITLNHSMAPNRTMASYRRRRT